MYIVNSGELEVVVFNQSENNELKRLATMGKGAIFGEIALVKNSHRNATVRCLKDSALYKLTKMDFEMLLESFPAYRADMLEQVLHDNLQERKKKYLKCE